MKGNVYTQEKCNCGGKLSHSSDNDGFICNSCNQIVIPRRMRVRFGRQASRRFDNYREARQFLEGLRFKTVEGTFDDRDYKKNNPLSFSNQAEKYLAYKKQSVSPNQYRNIKRELYQASKSFSDINVKTIRYSHIEDFLFSLDVSDKSRANYRSALSSFFKWLEKREGIPVPDMPQIKFELGWRNIIDIETQQAIIDEVKNISHHINPKIWLGIKWLSTYVAFRPNELRNLKERHIDVSGFFVVPSPKENEPKLIAMLPEDIEFYHTIQPIGLPDMFFFRHIKGNGTAKKNAQFGKDYLWKWWKRACNNIGIEGVDLYGGTRHSTATALSEHFSESEIMNAATMHKTNKAARRYIQSKKQSSINIYTKVRQIQNRNAEIIDINEVRKKG